MESNLELFLYKYCFLLFITKLNIIRNMPASVEEKIFPFASTQETLCISIHKFYNNSNKQHNVIL